MAYVTLGPQHNFINQFNHELMLNFEGYYLDEDMWKGDFAFLLIVTSSERKESDVQGVLEYRNDIEWRGGFYPKDMSL